MPHEGDRHHRRRRLRVRLRGMKYAQIVPVCREHGVRTLLTEDRDFHRFGDFAVEHLG